MFERWSPKEREKALLKAKSITQMVQTSGWKDIVKPDLEVVAQRFTGELINENDPLKIKILQANIRAIKALLNYIEVGISTGKKIEEFQKTASK